jgi:hypothetical protein
MRFARFGMKVCIADIGSALAAPMFS